MTTNRPGYALKLSPQEQLPAAFGFFTLKPPSCRASTKSNSLPVTYNALLGSTTTRMPPLSTRMSRLGRLVLQIHLVLQPGAAAAHDGDAQHAVGPALLLQQRADLLGGRRITLISRSSPTRKAAGAAEAAVFSLPAIMALPTYATRPDASTPRRVLICTNKMAQVSHFVGFKKFFRGQKRLKINRSK